MLIKRGSFIFRVLKILLFILLALVVTELFIYFSAPVYDFPDPRPFSGKTIYNPYEEMDSSYWKKANFHFHARAWAGLTSGRKNTNEMYFETYKKLGYDCPCISNYQNISQFNKDSSYYIPVYEHGFGIAKKHQLCIGAKKVLWLDYSLFQNTHNRQHILNVLKDQNEIVALAHPDWENGYPPEEMEYLSNYDLIEVLNKNWRSIPQWDAALSSGHPVYIVANDDAHSIINPHQAGICCTFINSAANHGPELVKALKEGKAFGADIYSYDHYTYEEKAAAAREVPILNSVEIRNDTLRVRVSDEAMKFSFIGQNGQVKKTVRFSNSAWYKIEPEDTYIRTVITFFNKHKQAGTKFYLNPVFRYDGEKPSNVLQAEINWARTWIFRVFSIPSLIVFIYLAYYFRKKQSSLKEKKNADGEIH